MRRRVGVGVGVGGVRIIFPEIEYRIALTFSPASEGGGGGGGGGLYCDNAEY